MNRRDFLAASLATAVAGASGCRVRGGEAVEGQAAGASFPGGPASPRGVKINVKPVMTNIIHTDVWEGPCRWKGIEVPEEVRNADALFARWSKELREKGLGRPGEVQVLDPVHITFSENFIIKPEEFDKIAPDRERLDVFFMYPAGSSLSAFEVGAHFGKPILLKGLGCRSVDIAAYTRSKGMEAYVGADDAEMTKLLSLLRARKVLRSTRVLFPTNRGLPAACSVGSIWDLQGLEKRLGVSVRIISYRELADEMTRVTADAAAGAKAQQAADELLRKSQKSFIEPRFVAKSCLFYETVKRLMARHGCDAFTIECFEFCSSRLPDQWQITPCLIHALLKDLDHASSCEADLGALLGMRLLMSVSGKSSHMGNSDPKEADTFRINHSAPALRMNGFDQPELPYQLGRFVAKGWGTKVVVDFMNNREKTLTVARVDPSATRLLVLKGELAGSSGWDTDQIGCSVEARIKPPPGRAAEFLRKRVDFGNHLPWVYGDYADDMRQLAGMLGLEAEIIA